MNARRTSERARASVLAIGAAFVAGPLACGDAGKALPSPERTVRSGASVQTESDLASIAEPLAAAVAFPPPPPASSAGSFRLLAAAIRLDGTTALTFGWEHSSNPDTDAVRVERASDTAGPWLEVATLSPSASQLDTSQPAGDVWYYRLLELAGSSPLDASSPLRAHSVAALDYDIDEQTVPGIPFDTSLFGVVHYPGDLSAGPYPLVVFLHGNHGNCRNPDTLEDVCVTQTTERCEQPGFITTPNAFGYTYLQDTLAAQGFVTLSIGANALNCRDDVDAFVLERIELVREHLRRWVVWSGAGAEPLGTQFSGAVDLSRVSLFGHSRGGAAVSGMPTSLNENPIEGVSLASVFALAPSDPNSPTPAPGRFATLLPSCDGDVPRLEGAQQYERTAFGDNPHPRAQVLMVGANHNFFNTQWLSDENQEAGFPAVCSPGQLIGGPAQRAALELVLSDWVLSATDDAALPAYMRADADAPPTFDEWAQTQLDLRWSYRAPSRGVIDNFNTRSEPDINTLGLDNSYEGFSSVDWFDSCSQVCRFPARKQAVRLTWSAPASARFELGDLDASEFTTLSLRFASSPQKSALEPGVLEHDFTIAVRDTEGASAEVSVDEVGRLAHGYPTVAQLGPQDVLSTLRIPLAALVAREPGLDTAHLAELELRFPGDGSSIGSVWLGDFELAGED